MWNKIIKKDNSTLPPENKEVLYVTNQGDMFIGWRTGKWYTEKCNWGNWNRSPEWFISGTRGARYKCMTGVVYWMNTPDLPVELRSNNDET